MSSVTGGPIRPNAPAMNLARKMLILLPLLCGACGDGREKIADYHWGAYTVHEFKQHESRYFGAWSDAWHREQEVRHGHWKALDDDWLTRDLNLSIYTLSGGRLLYLDRSKRLIQYYTESQERNLVISSIDTGRADLNFTPVFGVAEFFAGKPDQHNPMLSAGARYSPSKIFWGLPDDAWSNFADNTSASVYFRPWMMSADDTILVDHRAGCVYPRNIYSWRR